MSSEEPLKCGTFKDAEPLGPVVRVGRELWKQIRDERAAARDARMKREGAAEVWDQVANYEGNKEFPAIVRRFDALNNAARLREGGE